MKIFYAKYVLPITSELIENGSVVVDENNKIVDFGRREEIDAKFGDIGKKIDLKNALIMPGFVNAHTHLELSGIKFRGPSDFRSWLYWIVKQRRKLSLNQSVKLFKPLLELVWKKNVRRRINEIINSGTTAIGDVSNTGKLIEMLLGLPIKVQVFVELIAFAEEKGAKVFDDFKAFVQTVQKRVKEKHLQNKFRISLSPHAPYSVSRSLFEMIKNFNKDSKTSVHLAEVIDEIEFIESGTGFFRNFLIERNAFDYSWKAPGVSSVKYLNQMGFLDQNTIAVHCVNVDDEDIEILSKKSVSVCTCPRSNFFLKVGKAPIRKFLDSGINVCLGTDSTASNRDLSILNELKFAREFYKDISDEELIKIATINGARALGFDNVCGSIERGKDADLIYFYIPTGLNSSQIYSHIFSSESCHRL